MSIQLLKQRTWHCQMSDEDECMIVIARCEGGIYGWNICASAYINLTQRRMAFAFDIA